VPARARAHADRRPRRDARPGRGDRRAGRRGRHLQPDRRGGPGARQLRHGDARVRAPRMPHGDRLPARADQLGARAPPRARRPMGRDAEHHRGTRGGAGAPPGPRDGPGDRRRRARDPRRPRAARRHGGGPPRGPGPTRARGRGGPRGRDGDRDARGPGRMTLYARIRSYVRPYVWPQGVLAVVCMLGFSASEGAVPFLLKYTVDRVLKPPAVVQAEVPPPRAPGPRVGKLPVDFVQRRLDDFVRTYLDPLVPKAAAPLSLVVIGFFVLVQLRGWFDFGAGYLTDWIGFRVVTDLRNQETAHLQRLDHAFFNRQRAGQIVSRVTADASAVRGMVTDVVTSIFQDITRLIMFMGVAVYMDWRLAVIAVGLFPVAAGPLWYFSKQLRLTSRRQQEGTGRLNAMLHENVQGNRVVKAFGQEEDEVRR